MDLSNQHEASCELQRNQQLLMDTALFKGLNPALVKVLAYLGERKLFPHNHLILTAGEPAEQTVIIVAGEAQLEIGARIIATQSVGATIGGMAMVGDFHWLYSLRARQDVEVLLIPRHKVLPQLMAQPEGLAALIRVLVKAVVEKDRQVLITTNGSNPLGLSMI
jgi:CRP-like cAMP-binding protein